jgi:hypothetical protein
MDFLTSKQGVVVARSGAVTYGSARHSRVGRGLAGRGMVLSHLQLWRGHGSPRLGSVRSGYVRHSSARHGFI